MEIGFSNDCHKCPAKTSLVTHLFARMFVRRRLGCLKASPVFKKAAIRTSTTPKGALPLLFALEFAVAARLHNRNGHSYDQRKLYSVLKESLDVSAICFHNPAQAKAQVADSLGNPILGEMFPGIDNLFFKVFHIADPFTAVNLAFQFRANKIV